MEYFSEFLPGEAYTEESPPHRHPLRPRAIGCACVQRRQVAQWAEAEAWEGRGRGAGKQQIEYKSRELAKGELAMHEQKRVLRPPYCMSAERALPYELLRSMAATRVRGRRGRERVQQAVMQGTERQATPVSRAVCPGQQSWATGGATPITTPPITTPGHPRSAASRRRYGTRLAPSQQSSTCSVLRADVARPRARYSLAEPLVHGTREPGCTLACPLACGRLRLGMLTRPCDIKISFEHAMRLSFEHAMRLGRPALADPQTPTRHAISSAGICQLCIASPPSRPRSPASTAQPT